MVHTPELADVEGAVHLLNDESVVGGRLGWRARGGGSRGLTGSDYMV